MADGRTPSTPKAECICERCGRDYPIWHADNEAWNLAVNRTQEYGDEWQHLCPTCFVRLHEIASGRVLIWSLRADEAANTEDALYSWQQTAEAAEMELAVLRGMVAQAEKVVDSFDRRPTENCTRDVIGLAERLSRYRQMRDGTPPQIGPGSRQGAIPRV